MINTEGPAWLRRIDRVLNLLDRPAVIFILLIPALLQWLVPLIRSHLWLDEAVTWWVTNHGLRELIERCTVWPGSILYNGIMLLLRTLGAHSEWLLRLPSLVAALLTAGVLFDLAKRWFSSQVAIAALVFFCVQPWVSFTATDARPYAIGLLVVVVSTWLLLRWIERAGTGLACAYGISAGLIVHFHMLFATVLVVHALFLLVALPRNRERRRECGMAVSMVAIMALPLLPQYAHAFRDRKVHTFYTARTLAEFGRQFLPTVPMFAAAVSAAFLPRLRPIQRHQIARNPIVLAILWAVVPMSLLYVAALLTGSDLFVGRYVLPSVPGLVLCFGLILEYLSPRLRTGLVLFIFLVPRAIDCWPRQDFPTHTTSGDWASAISFIDHENRNTRLPALMRSPFPESDYWEWQSAPMNDSSLYAPLAYYRSSTDWRPLPATFTPAAARAIDTLLERTSVAGQGFYFAELQKPGVTGDYVAYFRQRMPPAAEIKELGTFEGVHVFRLRW
ncbi:MAG TPA: glycosyltransferase family 39 protein [Bryobacteraceae bacterium]|nr:glycosyltransferase family 39 protein [Bryobacteraceae bacterium]